MKLPEAISVAFTPMALPVEARRLNSTPGVRRVKTVGVIVNHAEIETGVAQSGRQYGRQNQTVPRAKN